MFVHRTFAAMALLLMVVFVVRGSDIRNRNSVVEVALLLNLTSTVKCKRNSLGHCERGTVSYDPWIDYALSTQRFIQMNLPWDQYTILGTHNSFNNRGDNYGIHDDQLQELLKEYGMDPAIINIAQQEFTMTDTLNFGIRSIQLDAQWCFGKLRLAHAGNFYRRSNSPIEMLMCHAFLPPPPPHPRRSIQHLISSVSVSCTHALTVPESRQRLSDAGEEEDHIAMRDLCVQAARVPR
jgi:hypothetical protein